MTSYYLQHFTDCNLMSKSQHGFRPWHSCNTQLVEFLEEWIKALENHDALDVMYLKKCHVLGLKKTFDSVPHQHLLHKLSSYGVAGKLLVWIRSFLSDRRQNVIPNGCTSDWTEVIVVFHRVWFLVHFSSWPISVVCRKSHKVT